MYNNYRGDCMKVYRCIDKAEKNLFEINYITSRVGSEEERKIQINTHNYYGNRSKRERKHFFLFIEDALNYFHKYLNPDEYCIAEYDIPEKLVLNNLGCGFYFNIGDRFLLETAIPFLDLIKESDELAYAVLKDGSVRADVELSTKYVIRKYELSKKYGSVPSHIGICNYCAKVITNDNIEFNCKYEEYMENNGLEEILDALNIKILKVDDAFDGFDTKNKKIDYEVLHEILKKYNLVPIDKTYYK